MTVMREPEFARSIDESPDLALGAKRLRGDAMLLRHATWPIAQRHMGDVQEPAGLGGEVTVGYCEQADEDRASCVGTLFLDMDRAAREREDA